MTDETTDAATRGQVGIAVAHAKLTKAVEVLDLCKRLRTAPQPAKLAAMLDVVSGMADARVWAALEVLAADPTPAAGRAARPGEYILFTASLGAFLLPLAEVLRQLPVQGHRELVEAMPAGQMVQLGAGLLVVSLPVGTMKMG